MNTKNLSIVAYLTIVGWAVSFSFFANREKKPLLKYHLKQSFGLIVLTAVYALVVRIIAFVSHSIADILAWVGIIFFIWLVLGIINALNETERPIPIIGKFFENKFAFIK